jgi:hypothetical protein
MQARGSSASMIELYALAIVASSTMFRISAIARFVM